MAGSTDAASADRARFRRELPVPWGAPVPRCPVEAIGLDLVRGRPVTPGARPCGDRQVVYGSRGTRPPILYGVVRRPAPITVDLSAYAQSLTDRDRRLRSRAGNGGVLHPLPAGTARVAGSWDNRQRAAAGLSHPLATATDGRPTPASPAQPAGGSGTGRSMPSSTAASGTSNTSRQRSASAPDTGNVRSGVDP
jgi:hypothetical protein